MENDNEDIIIDYNNNPEEYNLEDLYDFEFYEPPDPDYESDDFGNDSDPKNYFNNLYRSRSDYNPDEFISDPDSETEPDEGIQEDLIEDNSD